MIIGKMIILCSEYSFLYLRFIENRKMLVRNTILSFIVILGIAVAAQYQLEFDWTLNTISSNIELGYATWNDATVATLKQLTSASTPHHQKISLSLSEGANQLSFFFVGLKASLNIDNVKLTKPPSTINLLVNGDFELPLLKSAAVTSFADKIPGWNGPQIDLKSNSKLASQSLILNKNSNQVNQKLFFGNIKNYSFQTSINDDIQKLATALIANKLDAITQGLPPSTNLPTTNLTGLNYNPTGETTAVKDMMMNFSPTNSSAAQTVVSSQIQQQVLDQLSSIKAETFSSNITFPPTPTPALKPI